MPDFKKKAESIISKLGIPVQVRVKKLNDPLFNSSDLKRFYYGRFTVS